MIHLHVYYSVVTTHQHPIRHLKKKKKRFDLCFEWWYIQVVRAAQGRVPVFLDGGVRRGTDVFKAWH